MDDDAAVCIANIGPGERRKRQNFGLVVMALGLGGAAALVLTGMAWWWRLALFLPLAGGGIGIFKRAIGPE